MSVPTEAELRATLRTYADPIEHPTKSYTSGRHVGDAHRYGTLVALADGSVIIRAGGDYLHARSTDHGDGYLALAHRFGFTKLDPGVTIVSIDRDAFIAAVTA